MTKLQKRVFVRDLTRRIAEEICEHITHDRIPKHWTGHELRAYLADKFESAASISTVRGSKRSACAKSYHNDVLVLGL